MVYDAKTNEDITRSVLTQIIFEEESRGQNLLPIQFLRQLIRFYGDSMQAFVPSYLELSLDSFTRQQERMRSQIAGAVGVAPGMGFLEDQVRQNLALFDRAHADVLALRIREAGGRAPRRQRPRPSQPSDASLEELQAADGGDAGADRQARRQGIARERPPTRSFNQPRPIVGAHDRPCWTRRSHTAPPPCSAGASASARPDARAASHTRAFWSPRDLRTRSCRRRRAWRRRATRRRCSAKARSAVCAAAPRRSDRARNDLPGDRVVRPRRPPQCPRQDHQDRDLALDQPLQRRLHGVEPGLDPRQPLIERARRRNRR